MAVIVYHQRVTNLFGLDARTLRAAGPQANSDVKHPVGVCAHRRHRRRNVIDGEACSIERRARACRIAASQRQIGQA